MGALGWVATSGLIQGVIIGATLAFLTATVVLNAVARARTTTVNGWSAIRDAGRPGNGILVRAALQKALPLVNVFEEAAYWTAMRDGAGRRLSGEREYRIHFAADRLPPSGAFWSLTATDTAGYLVGGTDGRASVSSRTGLARNADGSLDILLRAGRASTPSANLIATPAGRFRLMLRVYLPGDAIVEGDYAVPPVEEAGP